MRFNINFFKRNLQKYILNFYYAFIIIIFQERYFKSSVNNNSVGIQVPLNRIILQIVEQFLIHPLQSV